MADVVIVKSRTSFNSCCISRKYIPGLSKTRLSMNNWHVSVRSLKALSLGYGLLVTDPVSLKSLTVLMTVDSSTPRLCNRRVSKSQTFSLIVHSCQVSLFHSETQDFRRCLTPNFDNLTPKLHGSRVV